MKRIAFYHVGIDINGGVGGANNFFINYFKSVHNKNLLNDIELYFITDVASAQKIKHTNFLKKSNAYKFLITLSIYRNRFKKILDSAEFIFKVLYYRLSLIHICQYYHQEHNHRIRALMYLPRMVRPKIVVNFIHCNFVEAYNNPVHIHHRDFHERFDYLFKHLKVDGYFSWYKSFCLFVNKNKVLRYPTFCYATEYYCCDTEKFKVCGEKHNKIIYASRFDHQKNPMMYLRAIRIIIDKYEHLVKDWKFLLFGNGILLPEINNYIIENNLGNYLELRTDVSDMSVVFPTTKCYVSTQDYENFTSLSMIEAMACGNVVIARNVGQTEYFVKDQVNGFLLNENTPEDLAEKIVAYIQLPEQIKKSMQEASLYLVKEYHNEKNFTNELRVFWEKVLNQ